MNNRPGAYPQVPLAGSLTHGECAPSCVPLVPHMACGPVMTDHACLLPKKHGTKPQQKKEQALVKDGQYTVLRDGTIHVISESYVYKTESYYALLQHELEGRAVRPASSAVIDAYVVPVCLERASQAKIPVCEWEISQGYFPIPSILYGLNYFATASDFFVVDDNERAKEVVKHITNKGKYPFCYQKLPDHAAIRRSVAIFGRTMAQSGPINAIAEKVYEVFGIPLVTIVMVQEGDLLKLSSLTPTKYSQLSHEERSLLSAYITHQEFL
ncbi:hypothetical protein [Methanoregula sp.]|uniref:hypothetical protein n=1 Tax=Methanoregula sp. TaxID=2052170 RepID=UPI00356626AD